MLIKVTEEPRLIRVKAGIFYTSYIDIWSPKSTWLKMFEDTGIASLFSATAISSDHGVVMPSPKPFESVLQLLELKTTEAIGDSPRRDLGGVLKTVINCILVGDAKRSRTLHSFRNLLVSCGAHCEKNWGAM